jgi:hypothetical protein
MKTQFKKVFIILMFLLLITLSGLFYSKSFAMPPTEADDSIPLYLPILMNIPDQIWGYVTDNGSPAANTTIVLYINGFNSDPLQDVTDSTGRYSFDDVPTVITQTYYVSYENWGPNNDPSRLAFYDNSIDNYVAGSNLQIDTFDIADVILLDPVDGQTISLPYTFQWQPRPATPTDNYNWWGGCSWGSDGMGLGSNLLGYADSFTLNSVPDEFYYQESECWWGIDITAPNGGYGESYAYPMIYYQSSLTNNNVGMEREMITYLRSKRR